MARDHHPPGLPDWYTPAEFAALMSVHTDTVTRWHRTGKIPDSKVIRTPGGIRRFDGPWVRSLLAEYIKGLRELADILEQHETVPLPVDGRLTDVSISFLGLNETAQQWEGQQAERARVTAFATGPARFCSSCGGALPGHVLTCPLIPAGPEHPAGPQAVTP